MTTRREQILQAICTALTTTAGGAKVYRSRANPVSRNQSPAVIVEPRSETAVVDFIPHTTREFTVRVTIIARGDVANSKTPDMVADPIIQAVHSKIFADVTLGGLAQNIVETGTTFDIQSADNDAAEVLIDYVIVYRTLTVDQTQQ